ncbi:MAG TPA: hypothetical protein VE547_17735, partial [Mycobacteriales bacterium]|nr:hypothetical protein [Mycobacteriales bacterium]
MLGTRRCVTGMAVLALALGSACSTGSEDATALPDGPSAGSADPSSTPGRATTASASPTTPAPGSDVLAVYTAWWKALQAAYARGDPADPSLADYAVDPILSRQRASIRALREQGVVQRTVFTLRPRVRYRTDAYAEVEDCVRGPANTYYDALTGKLRAPRGYRNDVPTEDRLLMTLQRRGERW